MKSKAMFTGLVEEIGLIKTVVSQNQGQQLTLYAKKICQDLKIGDSVAVNGVCLTAISVSDPQFTVQAVEETLHRTNLEKLVPGSQVNLERALRTGDRLGGHFVQGHVDGMGKIMEVQNRQPGLWLVLDIPGELVPFCVEKGSIALDGVSLTIADMYGSRISVAVIPHTAETTIIGNKKAGDSINIEVDLLGKYVYKLMKKEDPETNLTIDKLNKLGFE
ncbi:riboflavin synthase [candidate division KSB1 bacterium]|nr:riboflavin synthase [candidate division KSB1 bacterium]